MQTQLLDRFDPWKLATLGGHLQGEVTLERMPRLTALLAAPAGGVAVTLEAGVDTHNQVAFLAGQLEATVTLVCQRCLVPMLSHLEVQFRLGLVHSEAQAESLPDEYEPLLVPQDGLLTSDWVEDELILALPLAPLHSDLHQCEANGFILPNPAPPAKQASPFATLSTLLQNWHKE
jgi:uncharacterized protein